jgi:hypothetical protein
MGSFGCILVGVCVSAGCGRFASPTVFLDPALSVLVPNDTTFLAGVRMQRLRANGTVASTISTAPRLIRFRKEMGLTAESDVWEYLIASNGDNWLALMRGRFTEMGMEPHLDKPASSRLTHGGVTVLGDERGAVAFLNPTTVIAGKLGNVLRALDSRNENVGVPEVLSHLATKIPARYDAWFVSSGTAPPVFGATGVRTALGGLDLANRRYHLVLDADSGSRTVTDDPVPDDVVAWVLGHALGNAPNSNTPAVRE